jgi:dihydroorotase
VISKKMIDPHVHCRDWNQSHKETIEHALNVAERAGLSGIFDMPNTNPPITTKELVERRLREAYRIKSPVFYGLYIGVTSDNNQLKEAVATHKKLFPKVVGLKMYAGHSIGNLAVINEESQRLVYNVLSESGYEGVLAVHCEKESMMKPELWDHLNPVSHSYARPAEAEIESIKDQVNFAVDYKFKGRLHIVHVSTPQSVELIEKTKKENPQLKLSCGVTPHHCVLNLEMIIDSKESLLYKVNPPLRDKNSAKRMLALLKGGKIDLIETDHAPHTLKEKIEKPFMSGFPGLPFVPHFLKYLRNIGFSEQEILNLTHYNASKIFGIEIPLSKREIHFDLQSEYEVDVYKGVRGK